MIDYLKETVESTMSVYKTSFEEGRKIGYAEGYRKAHQEFREILEKPKCGGEYCEETQHHE